MTTKINLKAMTIEFGVVHKVGPYVTLFLVNCDPLPLSHFVTYPGISPKKYVTHLDPRFLVGLVQKLAKAPCTNSLSIVHGDFCLGVVSSEGLLTERFCPGWFLSVLPSVRMHPLQQKVKHHFKFHVLYA